jgi:hypothetical protein
MKPRQILVDRDRWSVARGGKEERRGEEALDHYRGECRSIPLGAGSATSPSRWVPQRLAVAEIWWWSILPAREGTEVGE